MRFLAIFFLCFSGALKAVTGDPIKTNTIFIQGSVTSPTILEAEISVFSDPLAFSEHKYFLQIQSDWKFFTNFNISENFYGELKYGEQVVPIWLEAGSQIDIQFQGNDFLNTLKFTGVGCPENNFLLAFYKAFAAMPQEIEAFMGTCNDAAEYKKLVQKLAIRRADFLIESTDFAKTSPNFQIHFAKAANYWTAYQLLRYAFDRPLFDGNDTPLALPETYYDFLQKLNISTSNCLKSVDYQAFLNLYLKYCALKSENLGQTNLQLAKKYLTGEALCFFEAQELKQRFEKGDLQNIEPVFAAFQKNCKSTFLLQSVETLRNLSLGAEIGSVAPDFDLQDKDGKSVKLSDLEGKVIYLDFWASWCGRCVENMPNVHRLEEQTADKNIVFLYVNLDKNRQKWQDAVSMHQLKGQQVWGEGMNYSAIAKAYKVKGLPTSIIIDKEGKIARRTTGGESVETSLLFLKGIL